MTGKLVFRETCGLLPVCVDARGFLAVVFAGDDVPEGFAGARRAGGGGGVDGDREPVLWEALALEGDHELLEREGGGDVAGRAFDGPRGEVRVVHMRVAVDVLVARDDLERGHGLRAGEVVGPGVVLLEDVIRAGRIHGDERLRDAGEPARLDVDERPPSGAFEHGFAFFVGDVKLPAAYESFRGAVP